MRKIQLGNTALEVSAVCMGTVPFGSSTPDEKAFALMDRFAEQGGNFLDTARIYADWLPGEKQASEKCIGRWLKSRGMQDKMIVATKGGHPPLGTKKPTLGAQDMQAQVEDSLRNLGLDALPLYYLHRDDAEMTVEDIMNPLMAMQREGKIRYLACSNWREDRIAEANAYAQENGSEGFVTVSNRWSMARWIEGVGDTTLVSMNEELYRFHCETGIPCTPFTSMAQGYLSKLAEGKNATDTLRATYGLPENDGIAHRAARLAREKGMTVAQVSQCYFYGQPFCVVPVAAFSSTAQLDEAVAATEMTLTNAELRWIMTGEEA